MCQEELPYYQVSKICVAIRELCIICEIHKTSLIIKIIILMDFEITLLHNINLNKIQNDLSMIQNTDSTNDLIKYPTLLR